MRCESDAFFSAPCGGSAFICPIIAAPLPRPQMDDYVLHGGSHNPGGYEGHSEEDTYALNDGSGLRRVAGAGDASAVVRTRASGPRPS